MRAVIFDLWDTLALWPSGRVRATSSADARRHIDDFDRVWATTYHERQVGPIERVLPRSRPRRRRRRGVRAPATRTSRATRSCRARGAIETLDELAAPGLQARRDQRLLERRRGALGRDRARGARRRRRALVRRRIVEARSADLRARVRAARRASRRVPVRRRRRERRARRRRARRHAGRVRPPARPRRAAVARGARLGADDHVAGGRSPRSAVGTRSRDGGKRSRIHSASYGLRRQLRAYVPVRGFIGTRASIA